MTQTRYAPLLAESLVKEKAEDLSRRADARLALLRADPRWTGPSQYEFNGRVVKVAPCVSSLAALDALSELGDDECLVVLTDRTEQELGSAVLLAAEKQRIETVDESALIPGLFGATSVDSRLHTFGAWLSTALLQHRPAHGWPMVRAGALTADFAIRCLLEQILGLTPSGTIDQVVLLDTLEDHSARRRWRELEDDVRDGLARASRGIIGDVAPLALTAVSSGTAVSIVAIGLAVDVLWPASGNSAGNLDRIAARTRLESVIGAGVTEKSAREFAENAISILLRRDSAGDVSIDTTISQAEALIADLRWADGAATSAVLYAGMKERLHAFAAALATVLYDQSQTKVTAVEDAYSALGQHLLSHRVTPELETALMAVRLVRWLAGGETSADAADLSQATQQYLRDGGWVDRALASVWNGSAETALATSYAALAARVQASREAQDARAASRLTGDVPSGDGLIPVEAVLSTVVLPISGSAPAMIIVLDGMSVAVATELAQDIAGAGWVEIVPAVQPKRMPVLAALPTVTTYSRTSLFSGRLVAGQQDTEKAQFAAALNGVLFHKENLRSGGGTLLPEAVTTAISDRGRRVVGVVLNTIDDALAKADPAGTRWSLNQVQHLRALLSQAAQAGRAVILTSDHGHVIERGGEHRPVPGSSARWRAVDSGQPLADEVLVSGPRVLAPGNSAILARAEGLRYASKAAGYHGGASLAELTIPLVVFRRAEQAAIDGWVDAVPQVPVWWNERIQEPQIVAKPLAPRRAKKQTVGESQAAFDLDIPVEPPASSSVSDRVLASAVYEGQESRAGRGRLDRSVVGRIIDLLVHHGGRIHKDTFATGIGIAATAVEPTLAMLRRQLNIDGFEVVAIDADGQTVVLDEALLREQFGLGS